VEAHCHILPTGLTLLKPTLARCETRTDVFDLLRGSLKELGPGEWLQAVHYDQTRFADNRHIARGELDAISADRPVLLRHASGHASVANTAALRAAGIGESTADPPGGAFERDASGKLTGVLLEAAHERVSAAMPRPDHAQMVEAILRAGRAMASQGIGLACDMMTGAYGLDAELVAYEGAAARGCPIRMRLYPLWGQVFGKRAMGAKGLRSRTSGWNPERLAVAGIKLFADGAIGARTAATYEPYAPIAGALDDVPASTPRKNFHGTLMHPPDELGRRVQAAHDAGFQVAVHAIGNYAADCVMDSFEATGEAGRHRIEHAMMLSDAQIERLARLGPSVCMQPEFLLRFGHAYRKQLGAERAARLKRFQTILSAGLRVGFSSDRPVVPGDPWDGVRAASARPEGFDPSEDITPEEAILAYTDGAARMIEDCEGGRNLGPTEPAEFVLTEANPLEPGLLSYRAS
jgi:hypothetical protein